MFFLALKVTESIVGIQKKLTNYNTCKEKGLTLKVKLKLNEGEKKKNLFKRIQRDLTTSDGSG